MNELPPGWATVGLGDVAETQLGRMLSARRETGRHPKPYLRNRDVQWGFINTSSLPVMDFNERDSERFRLSAGDVLVCEGGEVGRAAVWSGQLAECYFQKAIHRVRCGEVLHPKFLRFLLEHYALTHAFERFTTGSTIAHLPQEDLRLLPIPLPPPQEQARIIAGMEEQLSRLEAGVSALLSARRRLESLRDRSILALLDRAAENKPLGRVADVRLGRQRSPKNHAGPNMRPYLRAANVTWGGLDLTDVKHMNFTATELSIYALRRGDVLVAEASGSATEVGKPAVWDGSIPDCCFQNTLLRIRSEWLIPEYLYYLLLARARDGTFARASRGVGIHHLSKAGLASLEVAVPPIARQRQIVEEIGVQQASIAATLSIVQSQLQRALRLRRAILATAFSGELVPQDSCDKPATIVMERPTKNRQDIPDRPKRSAQNAGTMIA